VSSTTDAGSASSGRKTLAIILGVIAVLFIVAGIIYLAFPEKSLPLHFMGYKKGDAGHHALRMAGSFIVGIVCAAGAWFALAYKPKPQELPANTQENTPAGRS
jgi:uncharacterized membrane protein